MHFTVDDHFLTTTKAEVKKFSKGDIVISEGEISQFFLFLLSGELIVYNLTEEGKEFLQHKVPKHSFFGEPAVLLERAVPGTVEVCSEKAEILKIKRDNFLEYMKTHPERMIDFAKSMAEKAWGRSKSLKNIVFLNPEDRIISQLLDYKRDREVGDERILIDLTRKELSNMTGLRIETIIRTIKKMEKEEKLEIRSGKVYF